MTEIIRFLATAPAGPPATPPQVGGAQFLPIALIMAFVVFMLLTARSQRNREKRERENLFSRLSKNDRVLTLGGIIGTVVSVKDNEVVIKVDESTNTKMTFLKSAIQKILVDDPGTDKG